MTEYYLIHSGYKDIIFCIIMYRIKIACTNKDKLSFNKKHITQKLCDNIVHDMNLSSYNYISKSNIVYKKHNKFTTKFLEFYCDKIINERQFKKFIKKMHSVGFDSTDRDVNVEFIDINTNNNIYCYNFQSIKKSECDEYIARKNNSRYFIQNIFTKKTH